jgi:hypothetical protein
MRKEMKINLSRLKVAGRDLFYLLNKGYPKRSCIELIGNRYNLDSEERHILRRAVYSKEEIKRRKEKLISILKIRGEILGIDGYNVLITTESAIKGKLIILCRDGLIRDISGISKKYRISKSTLKALNLIFDVLVKFKPKEIFFYLDSPISKSGELAYLIREKLKENRLNGKAFAVSVPEKYLLNLPIVSTSDSAIIDRIESVFDLAGFIIRRRLKKKIVSF